MSFGVFVRSCSNVPYRNINKCGQTRTYAIFKDMFDDFQRKLGIKAPRGTLMGQDHLGNRYYEREPYKADRDQKKRRWVEREIDPDLQRTQEEYLQNVEIIPEWRAWLQFRRRLPPTDEEIRKSQIRLATVKQRGREFDEKDAKEREEMGLDKVDITDHADSKFPLYREFEVYPGVKLFDPKKESDEKGIVEDVKKPE